MLIDRQTDRQTEIRRVKHNLIGGADYVTGKTAKQRPKIHDTCVLCMHFQGRRQDFTLGATECRAQKARQSSGAEDGDWGGGVPLPNRLGGLEEPRPPTHFLHI